MREINNKLENAPADLNDDEINIIFSAIEINASEQWAYSLSKAILNGTENVRRKIISREMQNIKDSKYMPLSRTLLIYGLESAAVKNPNIFTDNDIGDMQSYLRTKTNDPKNTLGLDEIRVITCVYLSKPMLGAKYLPLIEKDLEYWTYSGSRGASLRFLKMVADTQPTLLTRKHVELTMHRALTDTHYSIPKEALVHLKLFSTKRPDLITKRELDSIEHEVSTRKGTPVGDLAKKRYGANGITIA